MPIYKRQSDEQTQNIEEVDRQIARQLKKLDSLKEDNYLDPTLGGPSKVNDQFNYE